MKLRVLKAIHVKGKKTIQPGSVINTEDLGKTDVKTLVAKKVVEEVKDAKK